MRVREAMAASEDGAGATTFGEKTNESTYNVCDYVIERLLEGIRSHPCVYDTSRIDYRDQGRKSNAWEAIRRQCGLATVQECMKLWKRLRDRYTREAKAVELATRSGSGFVSRRTWEFAQSMEFYKNCGRPRKTTCNLEDLAVAGADTSSRGRHQQQGTTSAVGDDTTTEAIFTSIQRGTSSPTGSSFDNEQISTGHTDLHDEDEAAMEATKEPSKNTSKKRKANDEFEQQLLTHLQQKMTENEAFGLSIGMTLERMTRQAAARCKVRIMEIIAEFDV
ncbi:transcription factor Adf-1-like [Dermacentor albipictus]|uniref:transcription factor Adf-1-like n=1 Tax=Dermacentor albipictus TaxID=60249 RepID=UPI0038FD061B